MYLLTEVLINVFATRHECGSIMQPCHMELTLSEDGNTFEGQQEGLWNFCRLHHDNASA